MMLMLRCMRTKKTQLPQAKAIMAKPVPKPLLDLASSESFVDPRMTPKLEVTHVHEVYDRIASQWAGTRYKAWPAVEAFAAEFLKPWNLVCEVGCGNGKNIQALSKRFVGLLPYSQTLSSCLKNLFPW